VNKALLLLMPLTALAACTAGPDYHVPERSMARAPKANGAFVGAKETGAFASAPLPDHWWRLYDDPRLDGYVQEALAANTDLRAADANLRKATLAVREAQLARTPVTTLSGSGGVSRTQGTTTHLPGRPVYDLGGDISYPLDLAGGIKRAIEAARDDAEATEAARDQVRVTVAAAVTRSYAAACSANRTLAATQRVLDVQRQTLSVTQRLFRGGRGTAFDVTRAQAAVDQSAAAIPSILAQRQGSLFELAALLGRAPADYPREVEACAAPPKLTQLLPIGDGSALIRRRADIREAERTLATATATIGVETAQLYPQVSLGGSVGLGGLVSQIGMGQQFSMSFGPLVSWTFPNRAIAHVRIAEAGAAAEAAEAQFDGTVVSALQNVETALSAYARGIDANRDLQRTRADSAKAVEQANRLFRFGRTGFVDVLTAQSSLASAETALAQSDASLLDAQIDVFLSLGGGWEGVTPVSAPAAPGP
jgi:NodT family efflux transporter outer membrane factor (OMF) lipoprotein